MKILRNIFFALSLIALVSCDETKEYPWNPEWDQNVPEQEQPENPGDSEIPETPGTPEEPEVKEGKARLVWIDAAANFADYANSQSKIAEDMKKIKETGFTGVIVEVRPTTAGVLFRSSVEAPLTKVDAWTNAGYVWLKRTESFDYLQAFIDAGKENELDVYAAINTMVGGKECPYGLGSSGPLFDGAMNKDWATVINTADGLTNIMVLGAGTKFLNPANDQVVEYLLGILADLASYDVAGIILDRCRYDDYELMSDFSDVSREKFESFIGEKVVNWPSDIFEAGVNSLTGNGTDLQKKWMTFRAKMIHDFMEAASARVHSVNADVRFALLDHA